MNFKKFAMAAAITAGGLMGGADDLEAKPKKPITEQGKVVTIDRTKLEAEAKIINDRIEAERIREKAMVQEAVQGVILNKNAEIREVHEDMILANFIAVISTLLGALGLGVGALSRLLPRDNKSPHVAEEKDSQDVKFSLEDICLFLERLDGDTLESLSVALKSVTLDFDLEGVKFPFSVDGIKINKNDLNLTFKVHCPLSKSEKLINLSVPKSPKEADLAKVQDDFKGALKKEFSKELELFEIKSSLQAVILLLAGLGVNADAFNEIFSSAGGDGLDSKQKLEKFVGVIKDLNIDQLNAILERLKNDTSVYYIDKKRIAGFVVKVVRDLGTKNPRVVLNFNKLRPPVIVSVDVSKADLSQSLLNARDTIDRALNEVF